MAGRLDGKVAIVTGAGAGIGEATALKFAREGAQVLLNGLPDDPVEDVAATIRGMGGQAEVYLGDVSEEEHARACVEACGRVFGKLDVLANIAGVLVELSPIEDYDLFQFDYTVKMNVRSAFLMTKFAMPHLQKTQGNIVFAGSEAGFNGTPLFSPYGGTKGFIHAFMKGVAGEGAKHGVRANCICPGAISTAWTHKGEGVMDSKTEETTVMAAMMGRRGTPEEMANVVAFLASDEASYVTGALWLADGGVTPAKGMPGEDVPRALRKEPEFTLPIKHARDGEIGKPLVTKSA